MVGLDKFKEAFEAYSDNYVIIGGTACEITLKDTEMRPRATHDIDMIVIIENMYITGFKKADNSAFNLISIKTINF